MRTTWRVGGQGFGLVNNSIINKIVETWSSTGGCTAVARWNRCLSFRLFYPSSVCHCVLHWRRRGRYTNLVVIIDFESALVIERPAVRRKTDAVQSPILVVDKCGRILTTTDVSTRAPAKTSYINTTSCIYSSEYTKYNKTDLFYHNSAVTLYHLVFVLLLSYFKSLYQRSRYIHSCVCRRSFVRVSLQYYALFSVEEDEL